MGKHNIFERNGNDLIKTVRITLKQALMGVNVNVTTLDNRTLKVPVTERTIYPGYQHRVRGQGMPIKNTEQFGDLVIKFDVSFPERLSIEQKEYTNPMQTKLEILLSYDFIREFLCDFYL